MSPFGESINGTGLPYLIEGRNKEHITLDDRQPKGREILKHFVKKADVLIRPSPLAPWRKWGSGAGLSARSTHG